MKKDRERERRLSQKSGRPREPARENPTGDIHQKHSRPHELAVTVDPKDVAKEKEVGQNDREQQSESSENGPKHRGQKNRNDNGNAVCS